MTADEWRAMHTLASYADRAADRASRREGKYQNVIVHDGGQRFDSKAEHRRWVFLSHLARAGTLTDLRRQVPYELIPTQRGEDGRVLERACTYVADFVYTDPSGIEVVEDVKGALTPEYRIKRKLMLWIHNKIIREVS